MSGEREDWFVDQEGNLTPPAEQSPLTPDTDEFGRDDPESLERERRRRQREQGRRKSRGRRKPKRDTGTAGDGGGGGLLGGLRGRRKARADGESKRSRSRRQEPTAQQPAPPEPQQPAPPEPAAQQPAPPEPSAQRPAPPQKPAAPQPTAQRSAAPQQRASKPRAQAPPPAAPAKPSGRSGGGASFGRRRILAIVLGIVVVLLLWFLVALFQPFAGDGQGDGRVAVNIPRGASASEVADLLDQKGVVSNSTLFQIRLKLSGKTDKIITGPIAMASGMSYGAAIDRLTGKTSEAGRLVLPEGYSRRQFAPLVEQAGIEGDYMTASKSAKGFDPAAYGAPKGAGLEGFLFPATYDLTPGETADDLVSEQLQAFKANISQVNLKYAKKQGNLNVYDVLKIASMIDREVTLDKERPLVAAVIWNRLHRGEPLGIDATTRYEYNNYTKPIPAAGLRQGHPVQHPPQRRPAADPDRQPGPRLDQGGGPSGQRQLHLLRGQAGHLWAFLHRQRGRVQQAGSAVQPGP